MNVRLQVKPGDTIYLGDLEVIISKIVTDKFVDGTTVIITANDPLSFTRMRMIARAALDLQEAQQRACEKIIKEEP